jgi:hypothetical protein
MLPLRAASSFSIDPVLNAALGELVLALTGVLKIRRACLRRRNQRGNELLGRELLGVWKEMTPSKPRQACIPAFGAFRVRSLKVWVGFQKVSIRVRVNFLANLVTTE